MLRKRDWLTIQERIEQGVYVKDIAAELGATGFRFKRMAVLVEEEEHRLAGGIERKLDASSSRLIIKTHARLTTGLYGQMNAAHTAKVMEQNLRNTTVAKLDGQTHAPFPVAQRQAWFTPSSPRARRARTVPL